MSMQVSVSWHDAISEILQRNASYCLPSMPMLGMCGLPFPLYMQIRQHSHEPEKLPADAYLDKVWSFVGALETNKKNPDLLKGGEVNCGHNCFVTFQLHLNGILPVGEVRGLSRKLVGCFLFGSWTSLTKKKKNTSASLMEALEEKSKSCRVSRYFVPGNMNFCAKFQVASVANKIKIKIYTRNQNCKGGIELKNILSFK